MDTLTPANTPTNADAARAPGGDAERVLGELRSRATAGTLDWDEVAYRARVTSRTLRRWVANEIGTPSPRLIGRLCPVLFAAA